MFKFRVSFERQEPKILKRNNMENSSKIFFLQSYLTDYNYENNNNDGYDENPHLKDRRIRCCFSPEWKENNHWSVLESFATSISSSVDYPRVQRLDYCSSYPLNQWKREINRFLQDSSSFLLPARVCSWSRFAPRSNSNWRLFLMIPVT